MTKINERLKCRPLPEDFKITPAYWRLLVQVPEMESSTDSGIVLTSETLENEEIQNTTVKVIAMGDQCFKDETGRFGDGTNPICKVGDWIQIQKYSGNKVEVRDDEGKIIHLRIINDDHVLGRVSSPERVRRYK